MTDWRPTSGIAAARRRAAMLQRLRHHLAEQGVLEVDTPALSATAVSDIHIESIAVHSKLTDTPLYLHTSPEFCMKRLLAADYPDIYAICRVFRDDENGIRHQPEFTMLEWYRRGFELEQIIEDALQVIAVGLNQPDISRTATRLDYCELFRQTVDVDPLSASTDQLADAVAADAGMRSTVGENRADWLDLILSTRIAPTFADETITILQHYPASQSALARLCPANPAVADRFEVFMGNLELANGYVELTDAAIQAERIDADQSERQQRGRLQRPFDQALIAALQHGLPPCAGVALGIERLHMVLDNSDDIRNVIPFPFESGL